MPVTSRRCIGVFSTERCTGLWTRPSAPVDGHPERPARSEQQHPQAALLPPPAWLCTVPLPALCRPDEDAAVLALVDGHLSARVQQVDVAVLHACMHALGFACMLPVRCAVSSAQMHGPITRVSAAWPPRAATQLLAGRPAPARRWWRQASPQPHMTIEHRPLAGRGTAMSLNTHLTFV